MRHDTWRDLKLSTLSSYNVSSNANLKRLKEYIKENNLELLEKLENDAELRYLIFPIFWAIKEVDEHCGWTSPTWCGNCNAQHNAERIEAAITAVKEYQVLFKKRYRRLL